MTEPARVERQIAAQPTSDGAGVRIYRSIGTGALRNLDPFLMLDHFGSDNPDEYIAGFPDHPHRGFITLTYMIDGHVLHRDSMGNSGDLRSGGAQWMKAASGVIHSEMPQQTNGLMRGFQLWTNLPASEKMSAPEYQEFAPEQVPEVRDESATTRVLLGRFGDTDGPIEDPLTGVFYYDVELASGAEWRVTSAKGMRRFVYPFEGYIVVGATGVRTHHLALLDEGDEICVRAGQGDARFIVVGGRPIGEPIVQYGPFVMNSEAEIRAAFEDYQRGRLVQQRARVRDTA